MTIRYTAQGCKVETRYIIHPNYTQRTEITLSVDPADAISFEVEERPATVVPARRRVRSTKYGFELYERRP